MTHELMLNSEKFRAWGDNWEGKKYFLTSKRIFPFPFEFQNCTK